MTSPNRIHVALAGSAEEIFEKSNSRDPSAAAFGPHSAEMWDSITGICGKDKLFRVVKAKTERSFLRRLWFFGYKAETHVYQRVERKSGGTVVVRSFFRLRGFHVSVAAELAENEAVISWEVTTAPSCFPWNEDEERARVEAIVAGRVAKLADALRAALPPVGIGAAYPLGEDEMVV